MSECCTVLISDNCVLETVKTYLSENPIQCSRCNENIPHDCMYIWNTGVVIAKHLSHHVSDPKLFTEYYEIYKRSGHENISVNKLVKKCRSLVSDSDFIEQIIPYVLKQQFTSMKILLCTKQYLIDIQGFKIWLHEFIIREFCTVSCDALFMFHCIVQLPCPLSDLACGNQGQIEWLTQNLRELSLDNTNGYTIFQIRKLLFYWREPDAVFLCNAVEKANYIKKLFKLKNVNHVQVDLDFELDLRNCTQMQYWVKLQIMRILNGASYVTI